MTDFLAPIDDEAPELMPRGGNGGQLMPTEPRSAMSSLCGELLCSCRANRKTFGG